MGLVYSRWAQDNLVEHYHEIGDEYGYGINEIKSLDSDPFSIQGCVVKFSCANYTFV